MALIKELEKRLTIYQKGCLTREKKLNKERGSPFDTRMLIQLISEGKTSAQIEEEANNVIAMGLEGSGDETGVQSGSRKRKATNPRAPPKKINRNTGSGDQGGSATIGGTKKRGRKAQKSAAGSDENEEDAEFINIEEFDDDSQDDDLYEEEDVGGAIGEDGKPQGKARTQMMVDLATTLDENDAREELQKASRETVMVKYRATVPGTNVLENLCMPSNTPWLDALGQWQKEMKTDTTVFGYVMNKADNLPGPGVARKKVADEEQYDEMVDLYVEAYQKAVKAEAKAKEKGDLALPKYPRVWIADGRTKEEIKAARAGAVGVSGASGAIPESAEDPGDTNNTVIQQIRYHFACALHRTGLPCYPGITGVCTRFMPHQISIWKTLVIGRSIDPDTHQPCTYATILRGVPGIQRQEASDDSAPQHPILNIPRSGGASTEPSTQTEGASSRNTGGGSVFGHPTSGPNSQLPTPPPSAIIYPELSKFLAKCDINGNRSREGFKWADYYGALHDLGLQRLDDLLDPGITAELLVDKCWMKFGVARGLLRFAGEEVADLKRKTQLCIAAEKLIDMNALSCLNM